MNNENDWKVIQILRTIRSLLHCIFWVCIMVAILLGIGLQRAQAFELNCAQQWTKKNLGIELLDHAATYTDMRQTAQFPRHGLTEGSGRYFLGKHPSRNRLRNSALLYGAIHSGVSLCLKPNARKKWQAMTLLVRVTAIINNYQLGVRFDL